MMIFRPGLRENFCLERSQGDVKDKSESDKNKRMIVEGEKRT